ncbi:MAG: alpha-glucosidase [Candidatus Schekmanbacteria bacterium]|nr:alpha-glucosidase [Candidatus Schekmanbacteria bacterium]
MRFAAPHQAAGVAVPPQPWWVRTVVYQICPRSFFDASGDGIGDLAGITAKLDYLAELGVGTLWLTPFYDSPQRDFGYDIRDFRHVAAEYGSLGDFQSLIDGAHSRGLRVVLDLVLNHTSDEHEWFVEARKGRTNPQRDWYVWRDGRQPAGQAPPTNWRSLVGGRGWHYDRGSGQWYWAQFLPFQPDLNYRNPDVRRAMLDIVRYWLDRGVDGFRLDIVNALLEDASFRDNARSWRFFPSHQSTGAFFQRPDRSLNQPETLAFLAELRALIDGYDGRSRFLVGEVVAPLDVARSYCGDHGELLNLVFLFASLRMPLRARRIRELILQYERQFPEPLMPTWVFSNHDRLRRISRLGGDLQRAKLNAALQLTARGVPFIYYGEEIGMPQARLPMAQTQDGLAHRFRRWPQALVDLLRLLAGDSLNRDECRAPMHWSSEQNGGFCPPHARPWISVAPAVSARSVAAQQGDERSLLSCYRRFLEARRASPALSAGALSLLAASELPAGVVGYRRTVAAAGEGEGEVVLVLLNACGRRRSVRISDPSLRLLVSTDVDRRSPTGGESLVLGPWEGLVLRAR